MSKHRINFDTSEKLYQQFFFVSKFVIDKTMTELFNEFMQDTVNQYGHKLAGKIA